MVRKERCKFYGASARICMRLTSQHATAVYVCTVWRGLSVACLCSSALQQDGGPQRRQHCHSSDCDGKDPSCALHTFWLLREVLNLVRCSNSTSWNLNPNQFKPPNLNDSVVNITDAPLKLSHLRKSWLSQRAFAANQLCLASKRTRGKLFVTAKAGAMRAAILF